MCYHPHQRLNGRHCDAGFSMIEILVATTVLALLLVVLLSVTNQTTSTVKKASFKIEAFASARAAQDLVTQHLSQATLNTYWDYYNAQGATRTVANTASFIPKKFGRASDLQFVVTQNTQTSATSGQEIYFQAPEAFSNDQKYRSTQGLLNTCGYFVRYGNDNNFRPPVVTSDRYRYRLMQAVEPTELFRIFQNAGSPASWITSLTTHESRVADNVIAMIVWPRLPQLEDALGTQLTSNYSYDSKNYQGATGFQLITANQLPPTVQLTFIVIDESSANRIDTHSSTPPSVISSALNGKFINVTRYQQDLDAVSSALSANHINSRILTATVVLRESKWSQ